VVRYSPAPRHRSTNRAPLSGSRTGHVLPADPAPWSRRGLRGQGRLERDIAFHVPSTQSCGSIVHSHSLIPSRLASPSTRASVLHAAAESTSAVCLSLPQSHCDDDLKRFAAADRRKVDPPIPVDMATWVERRSARLVGQKNASIGWADTRCKRAATVDQS
jgi:hypothetical protein